MPVCNTTNQNFVMLMSGLLLITAQPFGQFPEKLKNGLRYYLDKNDSARFITLNVTAQLWMRYNENNPYTTINGVSQNYATDMSIRRVRFVLSGALTDRVNFFIQFGQNNLNYL